MEGGGQLRLLLWRDYLIRKRKFVTLAGILWATGIMIGIYTVRMNIDNQDFPTCQFPARALPSAGMLPFLQSFICSVNNECSPLDRFEEIPSYQNSKLTQMQSKFAPLLNETVLELAGTMPDAVKLLATVANVADDPTFIDFSRNGLKLKDLFNNPSRVKRYVTSHMQLDDDVAQSLMTSEISFQGILSGNLNRCRPESVSQTLVVQNLEHLQVITKKLCALSKHNMQTMFMDLIYEINFRKYITMLGNMYYKISGDNRISELGDFLTALLRMTKLQNFLPPEALGIFYGKKADFSYLNLDLIQKFMDLLEPTFGVTEEYKSIREFADTAVLGIQYLNKVFGNLSNNTEDIEVKANVDPLDGLNKINIVLDKAMEVASVKSETIDPFNALTKLASIIYKFLPTYKHDILFYSTLLAKLMESAQKVIDINMHIQEITYNVTLRNPDAIKALKKISPEVVGKAFEALVSAKRTQILTSKLSTPGQMFCDVSKLQDFLLVSPAEADAVKKQLCSDAWKNYMEDLASSFGVFDLKSNINEMASLLIQETLGKDTSSQLYSVKKDFQILRNFTRALVTMDSDPHPGFDWKALLGITDDDDELMKVVNNKAHLGKLMLISVHGAVAKDIVNQNVILQYKITPILLNTNTLVAAVNEQLESTPMHISDGIKHVYGGVVKTLLMTANDEEKTYKSLSTFSEDILCNGGDNAAIYLQFPTGVDIEMLAGMLCNATLAIEDGLRNDSIVSKAVAKINNTTYTILDQVNWTQLVSNIQQLYAKLDEHYPYLFEFSTYGMDRVTQANVQELYQNAKEYWFGLRNLQKGLHLSINLGFQLLNLLDHGLFNMTSEPWLKIKFVATRAIGPLILIDDSVKLVTALLTNTSHTSQLPPTTVRAMSVIVPNLPQLIVDSVNIIIHDDTDIEPVIALMNASPPWPCSTSISELLELTSSSKDAVLALETLLCMNRELQEEWMDYLNSKKVLTDKKLSWNTTVYEPNLFLNMSSAFNALIIDTELVKETFQYIVRDESSEEHLGLMKAWKYALDAANSTGGNEMIGKFLSKLDTVVDSITTSVNTNVSLNNLWDGYVKCVNGSYIDGCGAESRALWKKALQVMSLICESIAADMTTYFTEVNDPDHNLLQVVGFTKSTALYMLYDRLPEFMGVLIDSFFDYGFMSQVRRASLSQFWDCDALVSAIAPGPGSPIQLTDIDRVKPYICPSFIYWLSLPRDDNVLFNLVAKPQYYFYSFRVQNATSNFESAFTKLVSLAHFLKNVSKENVSQVTDESNLDTMKDKLANFVDKILSYRLKETDTAYKVFSDVNKKQFMSNVYLTRVVAIVNKLGSEISNLTIDENFIANKNIDQENVAKITADLSTMKNIFKRRAVDAIAIHFDLLTDLLWKNDDNYTLIDAMDDMCNDLKMNNSKVILVGEVRIKTQICAKNYKVLYEAVIDEVASDYESARQSLLNLVKILQNGDETNVTDVFEFLSSRTQLVNSLKHSIKFSYDLGLPIYLKYLQFNLQGYRVLLTFLAGGNWWDDLRTLYDGPEGTKFFGALEQGFEVANNLLNNLDSIHLVRLIHDMRMNETDSFCRANITLSDYIPDATGTLAELKQQVCLVDKAKLFGELPPLLYASQGYESSLKLSKDIDYTALNSDISHIELNIGLINEGPKEPLRPTWITDDKLDLFRTDILNLLSMETLTKITFGVLSNGVDAGTLFLNNSDCTLCSQMTTWFKQLNLQLFKKQEYDNLLCHLHTMSLEDIYNTLKNDFHWDMFIRELISSRNYTKYELNKSMNEFLGLVEVHLLDDIKAPTTKLTDCLAKNVSRNEFGNATLFLQVLAHTTKLLRAETPHLHQVGGVTDLPFLKRLYTDVHARLDVYRPLTEYLKEGFSLDGIVGDDEVVLDLKDADVNLLQANRGTEDIEDLIRLETNKWEHICAEHDCGDIFTTITDNLNRTKVGIDLPTLQTSEFWRFSFVSSILRQVEGILSHSARLAGVASAMDVAGVVEGRLAAMIDVVARVLMDDAVDSILFSLDGLIRELHPLLNRTPLDADLQALAVGLRTLHQFKTYLLEEADLRLGVASYFPNPERVESGLSALGINHTNFWSLAAPRIHAGYLQMKPVLASKDHDFHISDFVCDIDSMSQVLAPGDIGVVSAEEVSAATVEQFCGLQEDIVKDMVMVLMGNADFTPIIDKLKDHLLSKLYSASDLTPAQGSEVLERFPRMAALLPTLQAGLGDVMEELKNEPLFDNLKDFSSVGNLLTSTEFLASAGNMMCGVPFKMNMNRIIGSIIKSKDQADGTSQAQLDVLPTDFCRSMYKEIVNMDGGKIVWSFVKPLLMGKILYTPQVPRVQRIIQKANSSFAGMIRMTSLVHSFSSAFPALDEMSSHREGVSALVSGAGLAALRTQLLGNVSLDLDVDAMLQKVGDLKGMGKLMSKASDLLHCINLNRFVATHNETSLMHEAARLTMVNEFSAGIVFLNEDKPESHSKNVEYKIRVDIENAPTTARGKTYLWTPGPESSFVEHMRYFRGFVQIQDMVDKAIIQLSAEESTMEGSRKKREEGSTEMEGSRRKRELVGEVDWAVYTQQEPYPCYRRDFFQTSLYESQALIVGFFFSLLFTVTSAVRFIVADKESGNTMLMSVMGVNLTYHTLSWFITSLAEMAVTQACVTAVLRYGGILPRTDPTLVFAMLLLFGVSVLSFCYLMSKLFSSASFAAVCVGISYLVTFMPFILILSLEAIMSSQLKLIVCLSMSSSLCYAFLYVTRFEAMGRGATWTDVWASPIDDNMSIAAAMAMVAFDAALYIFLGWLIDRYWGIKSIRSNIITSTAQNDKAGVSIVKVSKTYSAGSRRAKVALDNVSIELYKGQITSLLGHNGAGKTTLTNILTGMLRPTSGHVVVRGGGRVGACPQHDVLVECLTPREHIALYAQLGSKLTKERLQEEVDRMLGVLSLGIVSERAVSRLSGGTRRRVCVALAFVAAPTLVSLDEPTAGVDPAARRDIWDMIVKLKEDRTILLTTHHLDEAEILSDQIIIMHKGQVHTSGSPVEIKRSLGTGYKLTINLPDRRDDWGAEERTKNVVAAVREVVKNAYVVDISEALEMVLPFFDADGANNNFLQLCSSLEQQQATLGFSSYSMDCSTLEQVFCDICMKADNQGSQEYNMDNQPAKLGVPSKSGSSSSVRSESTLVPGGGPRRGTRSQQLLALLKARYLHLIRNRWLLFMLIGLPTLFVTVAMGFSMLRPPPDNEINLPLTDHLYPDTTQYLVSNPSVHSNVDPAFAQQVMALLQSNKNTKTWNEKDTPTCKCVVTRQQCDIDTNITRPEMMLLPDANTLNNWIVNSHDIYIEKSSYVVPKQAPVILRSNVRRKDEQTRPRVDEENINYRLYGGYSSTLKNNKTNLIAWYNNKGHHSMPAYLNALNNAILRAITGTNSSIITYSHPLKISEEQLSKDTVYQHIADAGVCALVLVAYSAAAAGGAVPLVRARRSNEKRLQLLAAVSPAAYWTCALLWDFAIIAINMLLTAIVMKAFGFPVFVERSNLLAICILIMLFGYACGSLVHVTEKLFSSASLANMMLFCGNAFLGLSGITILLILDVISDSDATDNARWVLHKIFMLSPQFALGDGMLEIAKNTIQAQVLYRFGMDTYKNPLTSDLITLHICYLIVVGTALLLLNLAIEYGYFDALMTRWSNRYLEAEESPPSDEEGEEEEAAEVSAERRRVLASLTERHHTPLSLSTIGNINRGFEHTEGKKNSLQRAVASARDVAQCVRVRKQYCARAPPALRDLTLGIAPAQCVALLGENGAGKSTTFSMLTGETRPTRGQIYLDGKLRDARGLCRGLISYCPQSDAIDPLLTVQETLQLYCRLRGIADEDDVIQRTIEMFDLTKYATVRSGALSGGNKRKLCTAIAFMGRTPLVLLDEPTSGMDPVSRGCVWRGVRAAGAARRGVLLSTHALDDARRAARRVALLRRGRLVALAPLERCLDRFGGGYVVSCTSGAASGAWRGVRARAPHASLRLLHERTLHFHLPSKTMMDGKEVLTRLSDIFRLMSELQAECDIEDFTVNQSSLEQMFLSFSEKTPIEDTVDIEPLPSSIRRDSDPLATVTSL